jgi:REP element-mobilizing transposase RayT
MKQRLRRLEWVFDRHPIYFVTTCTHDRARILANARVHGALETFAGAGPERGAWLGAYVLMPDHLHAFVALDDREIALPAWMKALKNSLSKALRADGVEAPHWQKGFFDHVLRSGESYSQKWDYVRENSVRAGLVARWEDWPFLGQPHPLEYRKS